MVCNENSELASPHANDIENAASTSIDITKNNDPVNEGGIISSSSDGSVNVQSTASKDAATDKVASTPNDTTVGNGTTDQMVRQNDQTKNQSNAQNADSTGLPKPVQAKKEPLDSIPLSPSLSGNSSSNVNQASNGFDIVADHYEYVRRISEKV